MGTSKDIGLGCGAEKRYSNVGDERGNERRRLRTEAGREQEFMGKEAGSMTRKISISRRPARDWRWVRRDWRTLSGKKAAGIENE
jgi:hypothetical protein